MISILILAMIVTASGCAAILEGEISSENLHSTVPYVRPPEVKIEVSNYEGLKSAMLNLVMEHENNGEIVINSYEEGEVQEDIDRACHEIMNDDPVGAFAVKEITGLVTRSAPYFEVSISIEYKRTKQQIELVMENENVSTQRYLRIELLSVMSDYLEEAFFRATMNITAEEITEFVKEAYYQNPRMIVMLPVTAVEIFPPDGDDRIYELHFSYGGIPDIMRRYGASLTSSVRRNAVAAGGENDAEILISLAENLIGACVYDAGTARTTSEHGAQNDAATAYGALVKGSAVGEGFAMAYKALCDELGFDCQVLLGSYNGMVHAWNIVSLYGYYYHIDVAMCAANGIETAFLKTDADFSEYYSWDSANTVKCNGSLTYEDFVEVEIPDDTEENVGGDDGETAEGADYENGAEPDAQAGEEDEQPGQTEEAPADPSEQEDGENEN